MGSLYISLLVIVCVMVICESLPVDRTEVDNVLENSKFSIVFNEFVSETGHDIVRRSKRSHGIINGVRCPTGTGRLFGTNDCVPCNGRSLPGCSESEDDPDYVTG